MRETLLTMLVAGGLLPACAGRAASSASSGPAPINGQHTLGTFEGTLPCADCGGIRTELTIQAPSPVQMANATYVLEETYLGTRDGDRAMESSGRLLVLRGSATDANATVYELRPEDGGSTRYFRRVSDNELRMLDRSQREIESELPYSLRRRDVRGMPGGYRAVDAAGADVKAAAEFAVAQRAKQTGQPVSLRAVVRAEQQVIAGMNYRLCLDVSVAGVAERATAGVFRDLKQRYSLTSWQTGCQ